MSDTILLNDDCKKILSEIKDQFFQCVITSPPYWQKRKYEVGDLVWNNNDNCEHSWNVIEYKDPNSSGGFSKKQVTNRGSYFDASVSMFCSKCNAWKGQLGQEPDYNLYINNLCSVFDKAKRILRNDGTLFVNIADKMSSKSGGMGLSDRNRINKGQPKLSKSNNELLDFEQPITNLPDKCQVCVPERFVIEMINRGWILRNKIIWHKPNQYPESCKDRFTVDFEYVYFFTKKTKYKFNQQLEPYTKELNRWGGNALKADGESNWSKETGQDIYRNRKLRPNEEGRNMRCVWSISTKRSGYKHYASYPEELVKRLVLAGSSDGDWILDPFSGIATTGLVARQLNRNYVGVELSKKYHNYAKDRLGIK